MNIFQKQGGDFSLVIDVINPSISAIDNENLTSPFSKAEFRMAIFSMHLDKGSGSDGYVGKKGVSQNHLLSFDNNKV